MHWFLQLTYSQEGLKQRTGT